MHAGTLRIINDATNTWTMVEAFASLRDDTGPYQSGPIRRSHMRRGWPTAWLRQKLIDQEVKSTAIDEWFSHSLRTACASGRPSEIMPFCDLAA